MFTEDNMIIEQENTSPIEEKLNLTNDEEDDIGANEFKTETYNLDGNLINEFMKMLKVL